MTSGYLNLVLHAHLPYIKHPWQPDHIEQRWFYEAVTESYLPLVATLFALYDKGTDYHLTISLSPTLCVMLSDDDLKDGCEMFMDNLISLCEHECSRKRGRPGVSELSSYYLDRFRRIKGLYTETYDRDLLSAFRKLREVGRVTLITCSATHAYLPIIEDYPQAVNAQIRGGLEIFQKYLGFEPKGFWLPECGYTPDIERVLADLSISFTVVDAHGLLYARPLPRCGIVRPVSGPHGVVLFGRDSEVSRLVWSAESGYPADRDYRDFYDDIVFELSDDDVRRFVHSDGIRVPSGIKYRKISGHGEKDLYDQETAAMKLDQHASQFVRSVTEIIARGRRSFGAEPVVTVAFDAELFGHWWHEGCGWLERILALFSDDPGISMTSGDDIIAASEALDTVIPERSSWGHKGYSETWINPNNDWIIRLVHEATDQLIRVVQDHGSEKNEAMVVALDMATRELLMLQASDWGFMLNRDTSQTYVRGRVKNHYQRVLDIIHMVKTASIDRNYLKNITEGEGAFTATDHRWFCGTGCC